MWQAVRAWQRAAGGAAAAAAGAARPPARRRHHSPPELQGTKVNSRGKEMPHGVRLYSIGSSRYGDFFDGKTTSL